MENDKTAVISTAEKISILVDWLVRLHEPRAQDEPVMYISLEGIDLCREGSISIVTLLIHLGTSIQRVCVIDVHTLGAQAFNTSGAEQTTLKDILQDKDIPKVFFDVRNSSDALFAHFGVALQGVEDVQLMESATRKTTASRRFLSSLDECVEDHVPMPMAGPAFIGLARMIWNADKEREERLFKPEHGGSYEVFNQRPIHKDIISYCAGKVQHLPALREKFWITWATRWRDLVKEESMKRVSASLKPEYQPHGPNRARAPWNEEQNRTLNEWNYVPPRD